MTDPRVPLEYLPRFREYALTLEGGPVLQEIYFCPFCGAKLPGSVRHAFFDELAARDLEIEDPALPDEFRSDRWWKARGIPADG